MSRLTANMQPFGCLWIPPPILCKEVIWIEWFTAAIIYLTNDDCFNQTRRRRDRAVFHPLQISNDPLRLLCELFQSGDHVAAFRRYSVPELYLEGRLSIILELAPKRNYFSVGKVTCEHNGQIVNRPVLLLQFHSINCEDVKNWDEQLVFVMDIKPMNGPNVEVPSFVRVVRSQSIHHEIEQRGSCVYFSGLREGRFKVFLGVTNGEFGSCGIESRGTQSFERIPVNNVESAAQIVDCVANHQSEIPANDTRWPIPRGAR